MGKPGVHWLHCDCILCDHCLFRGGGAVSIWHWPSPPPRVYNLCDFFHLCIFIPPFISTHWKSTYIPLLLSLCTSHRDCTYHPFSFLYVLLIGTAHTTPSPFIMYLSWGLYIPPLLLSLCTSHRDCTYHPFSFHYVLLIGTAYTTVTHISFITRI